jgi:predicted O-methyltransferase YrrM
MPILTANRLAEFFGYLTRREVAALKFVCDLVESRPCVIVNIGAGSGTSGLAIAEARPDATIYTVDISYESPHGGLKNEVNAFRDARKAPPVQILGDSREVGKAWDKGEIDMLFIDDGHLEHEILGDITTWIQHLKPGGYISFHDYGSNDWPDVKKVVDLLMNDNSLVVHTDTFIAFRYVPQKETQ